MPYAYNETFILFQRGFTFSSYNIQFRYMINLLGNADTLRLNHGKAVIAGVYITAVDIGPCASITSVAGLAKNSS